MHLWFLVHGVGMGFGGVPELPVYAVELSLGIVQDIGLTLELPRTTELSLAIEQTTDITVGMFR